MKYIFFVLLLTLSLAASIKLAAASTIADINIVPSAHCLSQNPCTTAVSPSVAPSSGTSPSTAVPSGTSISGQPNSSPSAPAASPSPSTSLPCTSPSKSSVSSQSNGQVSAFHDHDNDDKWHHHGKRGYLQNFIQLLLQLLQQLFQKLGININIPNTNPCDTNSSPSTAPSNSPSAAPSSGAGGSGGTGSGNPSPTVFGTSPALSSSPSIQPGVTGSTGGGTTTPSGRFGIALGGGWQGYSSSQLNTYFADMESMGVQWVRFDLNWVAIQPSSGGSYNWSAYDNVANAAKAHNLKVLAILDEAPSWAQSSSCAGSAWCPPNGTSSFAAFAAAAATHYAPLGVTTFEIWNEENQNGFWINPNAANYTALLKAAYTAIHKAEPGDFVVSGGVSPGESPIIQPNTFVQQMYANGAKGYFDALGIHPYCFSDPITICTSTNTSNTDVWGQMAWGPNNIVSIMKANGDGSKKIWMTEFGDQNVSEAPQEMQNAFNNTNGQAWAGPIFWYDYTGDGSFGLVGTPAYNTYKQLAGK